MPKMTDAQAEQAIKRGEIVFIDNFNTVKVCTDINTLTSFSLDKGKEYSKNRVMRVLNQYCNDAYRQLSLHYLGKINNDENGRNLIKGSIFSYGVVLCTDMILSLNSEKHNILLKIVRCFYIIVINFC